MNSSLNQGRESTMPVYRISIEELRMDMHECPGAFVSCIDPRFLSADYKFARHSLWPGQDFDHIKLPGAGINFLKNPNRDMLIAVIRDVCMKLHHIKDLAVVNHWDCGAYGYSRNFASAEAEEKRHVTDLAIVHAILQKEFPELKIIVGYSKLMPHGLEYHLLQDIDLEKVA
ncbi:MAG: hypothetical protein HY422_00015 [Candidatus Komeilibacteria bacterium]|nr:hypothetical protein [Candidatus Komeilibacteria bacterium]